jgi:hypothetical protein
MPGKTVTEERRRHPRGEVIATCEVFSPGRHVGTYIVENLAAGGACLVGEAPLPMGEQVRVVLQLPRRAPLGLLARVVRREELGSSRRFAVAFVDVTAEEEDSIHQGIVAELERVHARRFATVLVVDQAGEVRDALERDLREVGRQAVAVATPLEAVGWLINSEVRFETAVVNLSSGAGQGVDVLEFLSAELPHIRRVAMGDDGSSFRLDLAVRSGRAHAALRRPWNRADLLGIMRSAE